jgi:hypothetical protein
MPHKFKADVLGTPTKMDAPRARYERKLSDRFKREIRRGVVVTYPNRHGGSMWIMDALVDSVVQELRGGLPVWAVMVIPICENGGWHLRNPRAVPITRLDRLTVVPGIGARLTDSHYMIYNL